MWISVNVGRSKIMAASLWKVTQPRLVQLTGPRMEVTTGEVDCHFLHAIGWRLTAASGARRAFERLRKRSSRALIKLPLQAENARGYCAGAGIFLFSYARSRGWAGLRRPVA